MHNNEIYKGKRVLSIGASKRVLTKFSKALDKEGFIAQWTNNYDNVEQTTQQFHALNFDVIAFGRGVSDKNRKIFKERFSAQHPAISFVDGLAPITNLLIDQIKLALKPRESTKLSIAFSPGGNVEINSGNAVFLTAKLYRLNWLFQKQEKIIFNEFCNGKTIIVPKQRGKRFLVVKENDTVLEVISLENK